MTTSPMQTTRLPEGRTRLGNYQSRFVADVGHCIGVNWLRRKPNIRILDAGCDISGRQLWHLKQLTRGEVVGINIADGFPRDEAIAVAGPGTTMIAMDGMELQFPDESFDMVVSANVMEHVADVEAYARECARVLKPDGIAYIETAPVWTSARGHHIHEDMVAENCPTESNYRNDGSVIPDWSHLKFDEHQMRSVLESVLQPATCDYITHYIYHSTDLNKQPWSVIEAALRDAFPEVSIQCWDVRHPVIKNNSLDSAENHDVFGFAATGRKRKQNGILRRLTWRLRHWGF